MALQPASEEPRRPTRNRRRVFAVGSWRFECTRQRLLDACVDTASRVMESVVYWIGPLLILLASAIIFTLAYTFFTVLLPMIHRKHIDSIWRIPMMTFHTCWVVFILIQIIFNYASCVLQRHTGPPYDRVVRELAIVTDFAYPSTPTAISQHRRTVQDLINVRLQQRRQRLQQQALNGSSNAPLRPWMLQGPFEWGYCGRTNQAKPPRSHYDHVTKVLVLNLDHYCPWMFNASKSGVFACLVRHRCSLSPTVGYFNYRYFVTFLIYIFVGMVYGTSVATEPFLLSKSLAFRRQVALERKHALHPENTDIPERISPLMPLRSEKLLVTLSFMLCAAVGLAIVLLGGFHIYLSLTGMTTIEFHGQWGSKRKHPYSVGTRMGNWRRVFGEKWWLALLIPSRKEPEFLPMTVPGHSGLRASAAEGDTMQVEDTSDVAAAELVRLV